MTIKLYSYPKNPTLLKEIVLNITSSPHHAATNKLMERFIQTFTEAIHVTIPDKGSLPCKAANIWLAYRNLVYSTNPVLAMLFTRCHFRSCLDL